MQVKHIAECSTWSWPSSRSLLTFIKLPFVIQIFVLSTFGVAVLHRFYYILEMSKPAVQVSGCEICKKVLNAAADMLEQETTQV